ncbi:MAG: flagellar biosynthesis protein FlgN [Spirochaetaceae bacterium]|jgi:hypothetical protein|nr:flagellar biosynthesis protein FlgN [Spirochaetaceae bacterium]
MPDKARAAAIPPALAESEVKRRVAVLKRFKALLLEQKQRFTRYIEVLDKQKNIIENGKTEDILAYVGLEEELIAGIGTLQKSIEPMRVLYENIAGKTAGVNETEISEISRALENLKTEAVRRAEDNKVLLQKRASILGNELKDLRGNPFNKRKSIYAGGQGPTLFDISG